MKPKLDKNLSLPWTPQGEKASGNHQILLPREKATSLISPIQVNTILLSGFLVSILWPRRPCCCGRCITTVINTSTSFHLHVSKNRQSKNNSHIYMKPKWPTDFILWCTRQTLSQALHFSGKNVRLSSRPSSKTFLKMTEHSWTKTTLSRGGRRK